jgi:branched-subunit amino acid ABC-type transport system permease component
MALALQQLINGLTLGAVYGLIAIGYTMVYGIIGMINFAHGDIYMVSAFIAVTVFTMLAGFRDQFNPALAAAGAAGRRAVHLGLWLDGRTHRPTGRCAVRRDWRR